MYRNRSRMEIIADILISAKRKNSKTSMLHDANLNSNQFQSYLSYLDELKLLTADKFDERTYYRTTEKGDRFLEDFQEIKWLLRKESSNFFTQFGDRRCLGGC